MDSVIIAFPSEEARRQVRLLLESGGFRPAACCASGAGAVRALRTLGGGVVVCGFRLGDMTANELAAGLRDIGAVLAVSSAANLDCCEGENLYKLTSPVSRADFFTLLELILRRTPRRPLVRRDQEEQKLIRRAKDLLMDVNRMSEAEAHRFLQKYSMDRGWKLTETAQWVVDSYTH